jgi:uncharacterized OsmC-like protein
MAFAACVLKNVERFSKILSFRYDEASITVTSERQDAPPKMIRVTYSLRLVTGEAEQSSRSLAPKHSTTRDHLQHSGDGVRHYR